jgi:hypothetical protein
MKNNFFINGVKEKHKEYGSGLYLKSMEFFSNEINNSNSTVVQQVRASSLMKGRFYFMFYDLAGKTSKMEKFNPILLIDWIDSQGTRKLYGLSINFIPVAIRTMFFNNVLNYNLSVIEKNKTKKMENQLPLDAINFANIYKLLGAIGFEWAIREFDIKLVNKIYQVSTEILTEFLTMSTSRFTGVDDAKLVEIWKKKIMEQEARHKKIIAELLNDYGKMNKELNTTYQSLDKRNENLQESLALINKLF